MLKPAEAENEYVYSPDRGLAAATTTELRRAAVDSAAPGTGTPAAAAATVAGATAGAGCAAAAPAHSAAARLSATTCGSPATCSGSIEGGAQAVSPPHKAEPLVQSLPEAYRFQFLQP
eukprot:s6018_g3.t1